MEVTLHRITADAPNLHPDFKSFGVRLLRGARVPGDEMGWRWGATYGPCSTVDLTSASEALSARPNPHVVRTIKLDRGGPSCVAWE
jgi:hypothetical protein